MSPYTTSFNFTIKILALDEQTSKETIGKQEYNPLWDPGKMKEESSRVSHRYLDVSSNITRQYL
jgi:hypothetical protein